MVDKTLVDDGAPRGRQSCLKVLIVAAVIIAVAVAAVMFFLVKWSREPGTSGHDVIRVLQGQKDAGELATEIIVERLAYEKGVPPEEVAALKRRLQPLNRKLPELSEGEKHELAMRIRKAMADGRVRPDELDAITGYADAAARDGDDRP